MKNILIDKIVEEFLYSRNLSKEYDLKEIEMKSDTCIFILTDNIAAYILDFTNDEYKLEEYIYYSSFSFCDDYEEHFEFMCENIYEPSIQMEMNIQKYKKLLEKEVDI